MRTRILDPETYILFNSRPESAQHGQEASFQVRNITYIKVEAGELTAEQRSQQEGPRPR